MLRPDSKNKEKSGLNSFEIALLGVVLALTIAGIVICFINKKWFEDVYTREDGFIENFTIFPLSIAFVVAIIYLVKLARHRSRMFFLSVTLAGLFSFFVSGEELSWGQRIFHAKTPQFFMKNNAQEETNIHNLVVDGVKVNKLVFSLLLTIAIAFYVLVLPILYSKANKVKHFVDWAGIPVVRRAHIIAAVVMFALVGIIPSAKNSEILEMDISSLFLLILLYPANVAVFKW